VAGCGAHTTTGNAMPALDGAGTNPGATTVAAGTLFFQGSTASTATLTVDNGSTLSGNATLGGPLVVQAGGTVSPGTAVLPGMIAVTGAYTQQAGSTLDLKIAGRTTPGTDYDAIRATGAANLDGTIQVTVVNGFKPAGGDSYQILSSGSENGTFAAKIGFTLGNGQFLKENYNSKGSTLVVDQAPAITSGAIPAFTEGIQSSFTITASGFPAPTLTGSGTLPSGITFDHTTGILSGTPAPGSAGTYLLTFTAANGIGSNVTQTFTLTVNPESVNTTPQVSVHLGPLMPVGKRRHKGRGKFQQVVTVTNTGPHAIEGPLTLILGSLGPRKKVHRRLVSQVTLVNANGQTQTVAPGSPFISASTGTAPLLPGGQTTITLNFQTQGPGTITFNPIVRADLPRP
jgi:hypothetical protein